MICIKSLIHSIIIHFLKFQKIWCICRIIVRIVEILDILAVFLRLCFIVIIILTYWVILLFLFGIITGSGCVFTIISLYFNSICPAVSAAIYLLKIYFLPFFCIITVTQKIFLLIFTVGKRIIFFRICSISRLITATLNILYPCICT